VARERTQRRQSSGQPRVPNDTSIRGGIDSTAAHRLDSSNTN
jgi:hypothetical protein